MILKRVSCSLVRTYFRLLVSWNLKARFSKVHSIYYSNSLSGPRTCLRVFLLCFFTSDPSPV